MVIVRGRLPALLSTLAATSKPPRRARTMWNGWFVRWDAAVEAEEARQVQSVVVVNALDELEEARQARIHHCPRPSCRRLRTLQAHQAARMYSRALSTCTIITTQPNDLVATIHNRMPGILLPDDEDHWLEPDMTEPEEITRLLRPYPADLMTTSRASYL